MLYKGSTKIKDVYFGSTKIKEIYKGSTLIYSSGGGGGYPSGTVLFESATAGTHTLQVDFNCTVHLDLVGGGGAGYSGAIINKKVGGSGAYISGNITITAGTYTISVGNGGVHDGLHPSYSDGGNSSFESNIAGGGGGGYYGGTGGTATVVSQSLTGQNGLNNSQVGWINGYGAGGSDNGGDGVAGYCKIVVV